MYSSVFSAMNIWSKKILTNRRTSLAIMDTYLKRTYCNTERKSKYSVVKPGIVVDKIRRIPQNIVKPPYYLTGEPLNVCDEIEIKSVDQIQKLRSACQLARYVLDEIGDNIESGITTDQIDDMAFSLIIKNGAYPSPLNYRRFPKSVCTSVNNVACHGIPDNRCLCEGDIINVDVTVYLNGYHGDCSATFLVGNVDVAGIKLVNTTYDALEAAITICRPGENFSLIGDVVEEIARTKGYTVIPVFAGHGIGSYFHGPPDIYHCYNAYQGQMEPGMTFTIEPILSEGCGEVLILEDGWTAVTVDNSRTAQWEQTILITDDGVEILTE